MHGGRRGRGEGGLQGGGDEPGSVGGLDAAGGDVLGRSVHEAERGGGQPVLWQVGAEDPGPPCANMNGHV